MRGTLYSPVLAQVLPAALHEAADGRPQALLTLGSGFGSRKSMQLAMGMHFSVVCSEDLARLPGSADRPGTDFGTESVRLYQRACAEWPRATLPEGFYRVNESVAPVLLLSGGLDPATPPRHGERVATLLGAKARHVVVPNVGHGVLAQGCMPELLQRFIDTEDANAALALDVRCVQAIPRPPFFRPIDDKGTPP